MPWPEIQRFMRLAVCVAFCTGASAVFADAAQSTLRQAERLIAAGQASAALEVCLEARLENPESESLLFALGCAQAALAEQLAARQEASKAADQWQEARATFLRLDTSADIGQAAAFNAATCLVQMDGTFKTADTYEARLENLRAAIAALESLVKRYPEEVRAQKNLDHARYVLCGLLQNPPASRERETPEEEEDNIAVVEVLNATTEIAGAEAEVVDGSTVVLKMPGQENAP